MTKEQLQALGLDEDQIKEIFKLNGIAVGNAKKGVDLLDKEIENLKEQLKTANEEIEGFEGVDVEELKGKIKDYKDKYEKTEKDYQSKLDELEFNHELESKLREFKPHDVKDILGFIEKESLMKTDKGIEGLEEQVTSLKESKPYLFPTDSNDDSGEGTKFNSFVPADSNANQNKNKSVGNKFAEKRNAENKVESNLWS